jgi:hypothetical protein
VRAGGARSQLLMQHMYCMYADLIEFIYIYHAFRETSGEYFQALQNRNIGVKRGTRYVRQGQ